MAEELDVRYVMDGSVCRVGNQVRINAQLIDATTCGHLWADAYGGRFLIDFDAGIVTHHMDIARSPAWAGTDQL